MINDKYQGIVIVGIRVSGHYCNRCTKLGNIADSINSPCGIERSFVVPSRFANLVFVVLTIESLV